MEKLIYIHSIDYISPIAIKMYVFVVEEILDNYCIDKEKKTSISHNELYELKNFMPASNSHVLIKKCDLVQFYTELPSHGKLLDAYIKCDIVHNVNMLIYESSSFVTKEQVGARIKETSRKKREGSIMDINNYMDIFKEITYDKPHIYISTREIWSVGNKLTKNIELYLMCLKHYNIIVPNCLKKMVFSLENII